MSFDIYPEIGLQQAQCLRDDARALLAKGLIRASIASVNANHFVEFSKQFQGGFSAVVREVDTRLPAGRANGHTWIIFEMNNFVK